MGRAEVAEVPFTAFSSKKKADQLPGRLVVRRIPGLNAHPGQDSFFDTWRFQTFFTTSTPNTVTADKNHRGHAIIEQVHADLSTPRWRTWPAESSARNAAWLVLAVIAFSLTRVAATLTGPELVKATTATLRRKPTHIPARIATSARRITLHLPQHWPWQTD